MQREKGFSIVLVLLLVVAIIVGYFVFSYFRQPSLNLPKSIANLTGNLDDPNDVIWVFDNNVGDWQVKGNPPECPEPLVFASPVDAPLVTGILYPGQLRGGDYKPHGGFRFDDLLSNEVQVKAIMVGYILKAAKYEDGHGTQISIFYVNDCGLMVLHDHILTLSPKLQVALANIPVGHDSRTTFIESRVDLKKGDLIATQVGYPDFPGGKNRMNIFVDFGLYDLRQTNGVEYSDEFRSQQSNVNEYGRYAVCWLDLLEEPAQSIVKSLPAGGSEGKVSDYCQ